MRQFLVGGGLLDLATLHPLGALVVVFAAYLVIRQAARTLGGRRGRSRRAPPSAEGEGPRPAGAG